MHDFEVERGKSVLVCKNIGQTDCIARGRITVEGPGKAILIDPDTGESIEATAPGAAFWIHLPNHHRVQLVTDPGCSAIVSVEMLPYPGR